MFITDSSVGVDCCICNSQPTKDEFAIDTEIFYSDPARAHMGVRHRIVCQKCAEEIVQNVPSKRVDKLVAEVKTWKGKYAELIAALDTFTSSVVHVHD